jgi:hypothetical protein
MTKIGCIKSFPSCPSLRCFPMHLLYVFLPVFFVDLRYSYI